MTAAGIGGGGYLALVPEVTMGTYLDPSTSGAVFVPIMSETLAYTSQNYYSTAISQSAMARGAKPNYYSVAGDISLEVDMNFLPYFLYASRFAITKTGSMAPYAYTFKPSFAGAASTAASGAVMRTMSLTTFRNGLAFGYAGCVCQSIEFTIDNGILMATLGILGLSETPGGAAGTPAWVAPSLFGADAHSIYLDTAGLSPTFASASLAYNGFTATLNHNGAAQNRINAARSASYISFGETEVTYSTELDFLDRTEYNDFAAVTARAVKLESLKGGTPYSMATEALQLIMYNSFYDTYPVNMSGMADLIMASVTGKAVGITGGSAFQLSIKSGIAIT